MANEITITYGMSRKHATNTLDTHDVTVGGAPVRKTITQTGVGQYDVKPSIGTSEETITFTDIATNGWCVMINLDTTNYVEWGFSTGVYGGRMRATEPVGPFRVNAGATLYLKANTGACRVRVIMYED
tara:strand:+ start:43 stop:426 length:384 start_codon:yes stop_codon:yes gene_type:complete